MIFRGAIYLVNRGANSLSFSTRVAFIEGIIAANPSQKRFRKGWLNRLNRIQYGSLTHNTNPAKKVTFPDV